MMDFYFSKLFCKKDKLYIWLKCQINLERGLKSRDTTTKLDNVPPREEEKER
jgi:hypothetical protein